MERSLSANSQEKEFRWHEDIKALHVEIDNPSGTAGILTYSRLGETANGPVRMQVDPHGQWRFSVCKSSPADLGVRLAYPRRFRLQLYELFDRAHYPTAGLEPTPSPPLP